MNEDQSIVPVILCGGAGTRLWPSSTRERPKQMLRLAGAETMLHLTAQRVADRSLYGLPIVVTSPEQAEAVEAEVDEIAVLILEPIPRNTAPAIALAALTTAPDAVLLVLPSDHLIRDTKAFDDAVRRALPFAREGWIVTFGMKPDRPETGYGYIRRGEKMGDGIYRAESFVEKPDAATAESYLAEGRYDWNGGIFLMRADTVTEGLEMHAPAILSAARSATAAQSQDGNRRRPDPRAFAASPSQSIDYALMEKAEKIAVAPISVGWSDIGSWAAVHENGERDEAGNLLSGDITILGARNCLIRSEGPQVVAIDVEDLVIVATPEAVLVVPRSHSQRVKEVVPRLEERERAMRTWPSHR